MPYSCRRCRSPSCSRDPTSMGAGCPDPVVHRPHLPRALLCKCGSCPGTALVAACKLRGLHEGSGGARGRLSRGRRRAPLTATLEQPPLRLRPPPLLPAAGFVQTRRGRGKCERVTLDPSALPLAVANWFSGVPGRGHEREHQVEAAAVSSAQQSRVPDFPFFNPRQRKPCCGVRRETSFPSKSTDACR